MADQERPRTVAAAATVRASAPAITPRPRAAGATAAGPSPAGGGAAASSGAETSRKAGSHGRIAYAPGLDGVRAVAVTAVLVYHLGTTGLNWRTAAGDLKYPAPGGFLGVDVFFVLSGYLITSLLLAERVSTGRIRIGQFYLRRARRLLPALYALLTVVAFAAAFGFTGYAAQLRGDLVAAIGYATNWWLIAGHTSYFGAGAHLPLLTHLWSLAVEEQYYLIWPLLLVGLTRLRRRAPAVTCVVTLIAASTVLMVVLYDPYGDPSRLYYGTDTRFATPLLGALLAIVTRTWPSRPWDGARRAAAEVTGVVALAALVAAFGTLDDHATFLYRGGFLLVAAVSGTLVVVAAHPSTTVGKALGIAPLRWLGERSYAIYLWHWPIFAVTQPGINVRLDPVSDTVLRLGLTLIAAELSYRVIERPFRSGAFGRAWRSWRASTGRTRRFGSLQVTGVTLVVLAAAGIAGIQLGGAAPPKDQGAPVGPGPDTALGVPSTSPAPSVSVSASAAPSPSASAIPSGAPATPPLTVPAHPPKVAVFGDSQGMTLLINAPANTSKYAKFVDDTIEGCGVLLGKITSRSGEKRDLAANCPNWLSVWRSRAARDKPDIALVMIGAWEVFNLQVDGQTLTFGTPAWDANFTTQLEAGIGALRASGAQVAIALLPCYRPIRASAGYWPERGDDDRTRHVNDLIVAAASSYVGGVTTVDPPSEFCDDPKIAKSLSYRWDGVHYYKPGALLYMTAVIPQLLAIT